MNTMSNSIKGLREGDYKSTGGAFALSHSRIDSIVADSVTILLFNHSSREDEKRVTALVSASKSV